MITLRRASGWCAVGLVGLALLLQGCGTVATRKVPAPSYRGVLPAVDAVQFVTPKIGFIAGQGIVLTTDDGGVKWTRIYNGRETIRAIDFIGKFNGWVLTASGSVLAWNGGPKWQRVASALGRAAAMHLAAGGAGLIVTARGMLYRAGRPGGPWQREGLQGVSALSFSASQTGWAVTISGTTAPQVWRTRDGGKTWTLSFTPQLGQPQGWTPTLASSGDAAWLLLTSAQGQLEHQPYVAFATTDLGMQWQEALSAPLFVSQGMYPGAPASLYGLQAGPVAVSGQSGYFLSWAPATPNDILALTVTRDGGQTWRQIPLQKVQPSETPDFFEPLGMALGGSTTLWLVGSRNGRGRVLVSHDGGVHWSAPAL